jgi:hypothetical protein
MDKESSATINKEIHIFFILFVIIINNCCVGRYE